MRVMIPAVYEIVQHTADIRIHVRAASIEALFEDALLALMEVAYGPDVAPALSRRAPAEEPAPRLTRRDQIESGDRTALLVDFLNEALTQCHVDRRRYIAAAFSSLAETNLVATLTSVPAGEFYEDVKAVTYHEADVRHVNGTWETALVLDI